MRHDDAILDGERVVGQARDEPLPRLHRLAKRARERELGRVRDVGAAKGCCTTWGDVRVSVTYTAMPSVRLPSLQPCRSTLDNRAKLFVVRPAFCLPRTSALPDHVHKALHDVGPKRRREGAAVGNHARRDEHVACEMA